MKKEYVKTTENDVYDWQVKFDKYLGTPYAEIVPISKRYKGKIIKRLAIRWYNKIAWNGLVKAINEVDKWIQENDAWNVKLKCRICGKEGDKDTHFWEPDLCAECYFKGAKTKP